MVQGLLTALLAVTGLCVGSFLNVVIWRVPRDESIVRPGSHCPSCQRPLSWYENIPVLSFLVLRGRCRTCHTAISWRYPGVELLTGALFVLCLRRFDWTPELASALVFTLLLVALAFIDLDTWLLPFALTLPGIAVGLALQIPLGVDRLIEGVIGGVAAFFGFWAMEWAGRKLFQKEALGGGDKYLLAMIGVFLGYRPLLGVITLASAQGAVVGMALIALRGRAGPAPKPESKAPDDDWEPGATNIPFGPWLAVGAMEVLLAAPHLSAWVPGGMGWALFGG